MMIIVSLRRTRREGAGFPTIFNLRVPPAESFANHISLPLQGAYFDLEPRVMLLPDVEKLVLTVEEPKKVEIVVAPTVIVAKRLWLIDERFHVSCHASGIFLDQEQILQYNRIAVNPLRT